MLFQRLSPIGPVRSEGVPTGLRWEWPVQAAHWLHRCGKTANGGFSLKRQSNCRTFLRWAWIASRILEEPHRFVFGGTLLLRGLAMFSRQTTLVEFANTNTIDTERPL
jgi:hypothetical protein